MATLRTKDKLVCFKIVYCGAPASGKSSSLGQLHGRLQGDTRCELIRSTEAADSTLHLEFEAPGVEVAPGHATLFQIYTAPGEVSYAATSSLLLRNVDGIVFVVDAQVDRQAENILAWQRMEAALRTQEVLIDELPVALQFNKRDLPNSAPADYLEYLYNSAATRRVSFETDATQGLSVFAAFTALSEQVLARFHRQVIEIEESKGEDGAEATMSELAAVA